MKFRDAIILLALLFILPAVFYGQNPPQAIININLPLDFINNQDNFDIVIKNKLIPTYEPNRIVIISRFTINPEPEELRISLNEGTQLNLKELSGKTILLKFNERSIYVRFDNPITGFYDGITINILNKPQPILQIKNISLQPSVYNIRVFNEFNKEDLFNEDKNFLAGENPAITLEEPDAWKSLQKSILTEKSLFISIISGLIIILLGVLKNKIESGFKWVLDFLGKYSSGRLADRRFEQLYLKYIISNHKYLKIVGFNKSGVSRPLLEEVFVSLRIAGFSQQPDSLVNNKNPDADADGASLSFANALAQHKKMVILGGPGAGKTTTLSYSVLVYAQNKTKEKFGIQEDLLPVFIPLRRLSSSNKSILDDLIGTDSQIIPQEQLKECPPKFFEKKLKKGQCLILFDGLDEVIDEKTHREVAERINAFIALYPDNRFIVTCRIAGWKNLLSGEFTVLQTHDFNRNEIQRFVLGWYRAVVTDSERTRLKLDNPDPEKFKLIWSEHYNNNVKPAIESKSKNLLRQIDSNNRILQIAINPLLLSLICLVHYFKSVLPQDRSILYSRCLDLLIEDWERQKGIALNASPSISTPQKESVLREIAFEFQTRGISEENRDNLEKFIEEILKNAGISMPPHDLLNEMEQRSGLLNERSIDVFGFTHLTLQEYLVAKHLQLNQKHILHLSSNYDRQEWREVTLLYAGLLDDATNLIKEIISDDKFERKILAAYCLGDAQNCSEPVANNIIDELLSALITSQQSSEELIGALASVASDFSDLTVKFTRPVKPRELLSYGLIMILQTQPPEYSEENLRDIITILGKARITKSLPTLVLYLSNLKYRDQALSALVSFGDLAIPVLRKFIDIEHSIDFTGGYSESFQLLDKVQPEMKPHDGTKNLYNRTESVKTIEAIIRVLEQINTETSAKMLISLYDHFDLNTSNNLQAYISFALAKLFRNSFIEAEIQQISFAELPDFYRLVSLDGEHFIYDVPSQSAFYHLEKLVRIGLTPVISEPEIVLEKNYPEAGQQIASSLSFKIVFPVIVKNIKVGIPFLIDKPATVKDVAINDSKMITALKSLGFENTEDNKLLYLGKQIKKTNMSVEQSLAYTASEESGKINWVKKYLPDFAKYFGNLTFLTILIVLGVWDYLIIEEYFRRSNAKSLTRTEDFIYFYATILPTLYYLSLAVYSHFKLKRKTFSFQILGSLIFGYANFVKTLPLTTKFRTIYKLIALNFLLWLFSPLTIIIFGDPYPESLFVFSLPCLLFTIASFVYLYDYVLRINPILQLALRHPEGRRLLRGKS